MPVVAQATFHDLSEPIPLLFTLKCFKKKGPPSSTTSQPARLTGTDQPRSLRPHLVSSRRRRFEHLLPLLAVVLLDFIGCHMGLHVNVLVLCRKNWDLLQMNLRGSHDTW